MMPHVKKEYSAKAMGQSGSPHYPVDPPRTGFADSSYNSTVQDNDAGAGRGTGSQPDLQTSDNHMFLEE